MDERLFSPYWYRVAELRPQLRAHIRLHRHVYRGERCYVLENPASREHHRLPASAYYVLSLLDGHRTVAEIWNAALDRLGDAAPTQSQMITLLAQLHDADAMRCEVPPDTGQLFERQVHHRAQQGAGRRFQNPLYLRFPLWDPDVWLTRWEFRARRFLTRTAWLLWCALVAAAGFAALRHADELYTYARATVWEPKSVVLLVVAYPIVKALHELGHAFAAKHWGAAVHEIGLMLLIGMPVPYVDASSTSVFPSKRARIVVGAAGVIVELALASLALFVWLSVSPGFVKLAAFQVMAIGGVSTLFFNGNPLIRFDGYYVLADALEIPNLGTRANAYLQRLFETRILGLDERRPLDVAPGERPWLVGYAVLALGYRIFLTLAISLFVASRFLSVGIALAIWSLLLQLGAPLVRGLSALRTDPRVGERPFRVASRAAACAATVGLALFAVPFPLWTVSEGVVWLPERAQVRAGSAGVVARILARPDSVVAAGTPLVEIRDALLDAEVAVLEARVAEARARLAAKHVDDRVGAQVAREELAAVAAELARAQERQRAGVVTAAAEGRFVLPRAADLLGRYFQKGEVIGYVNVGGPASVRVVVPQSSASRVRDDTRAVSVRFPGGAPIPARIEREVPQATDHLPSLALGAAGGGDLAVDRRDQHGLTAVESLFQFDVRLAEARRLPGLGAVAAVRFDHGSEPIGWRGLRAVRRLFLGRLRV